MEALKMPVRRSLTADLVEQLKQRMQAGSLVPGDRLPTERVLGIELGVSRTVVREAIARLSAEGWVEARQGSGVFVVTPAPQAFQVTATELEDLRDVMRLLELRLAVETEMAGLAAERRNQRDITELKEKCAAIATSIQAGGDGTLEDSALHATIAKTTRNHYFIRFNEFLGARLVPPRKLAVSRDQENERLKYLDKIQGEHEAIVSAISDGDVEAARAAARSHLENSLQRHKRRAAEAKAKVSEIKPKPADR
jgi:GntR family transcriptional regulator, transcriptional repressor for pyruvate dehydrogenase complex